MSAKVFEWVCSDDDPDKYECRPVLKHNRFEVLSLYTTEQKKYDAILNEWDCCNEFAPNETLDPDLEDVIEYHHVDYEPIANLTLPPVCSPF